MIHPPTIFRQQLGDCFTCPPCTALQVLLERAGLDPWIPSRRFILAIWVKERRSQSLISAIEIVKHHGVCPEELYPYNPGGLSRAEFYAYPPVAALQAAKPFAGVQCRKVDRNLRDITKWLEEGIPIMFSFAVDLNDLNGPIGKHAVYIAPRRHTPYYHAATVLGRDKDRFIILNSYGEKWGDCGTFRISAKHLLKHGRHFAVMTELPTTAKEPRR